MESCAGRVIVLARRLDGRLLLARLGRRERVLEAADRRAESASCLRQSLGAEHDQRGGEKREEVGGAEGAGNHRWSLSFGAVGPPLSMRLRLARAGVRSPATCVAIGLDAGGWRGRGSRFGAPLVDALMPRPTNAARRATPRRRGCSLTLSGVRSLGERRDA